MDEMQRLLRVMARLRDPDGGCPWDMEQDFASIAPYTIEEAYEVSDAIAREDWGDLEAELGDLLLQVVYHAQMASERELFAFDDVVRGISDKMIRRHPHVFADATIAGSDAQSVAWEEHKAGERQARAAGKGSSQSILDDVPLALPALMRAQKLQKRAARVGFDWPRLDQVIAKLHEELGEVQEEIDQAADRTRLTDEMGDVLFAAVNVARWLNIDPEEALRGANAKFERRFHHIESSLAQEGRTPADADLHEMEAMWQRAKRTETT